MLAHEPAGGITQLTAPSRVASQLADCLFQLITSLDLNGGAGFDQPGNVRLEVPGVRAEQHRRSVSCRLDHVLATALTVETASHKSNVRQAPKSPQFADGIDQDDGLAIVDRPLELAAATIRHARPLQQCIDLVEAILLARHDEEP